ncbi:MAG: hypothetical protein FWE95_07805 [Planctomycetaceae bacterium]|nr:hypothetical protein [Planctomycetaceae bacterium]
MITDIAQKTIITLGLVPDEDVFVGVFDPDWHGKPKIMITTEVTRPADQTQFGVISIETVLVIDCIAKTQQEAWDTVQTAARAVYAKFETLENDPKSRILCIMHGDHNVYQVPDRNAFQAFMKFNLLHSFTL